MRVEGVLSERLDMPVFLIKDVKVDYLLRATEASAENQEQESVVTTDLITYFSARIYA